MPRRRSKKAVAYVTNDAIVGFGEVPAVQTSEGLQWVLPGRVMTTSKEVAMKAAAKLDRLVRANLERYDRELLY